MATFTLLGGCRLAEPFAGGGVAINLETRTLYAYVNNPNEGRVGVAVFDLPAHGESADTEMWCVGS